MPGALIAGLGGLAGGFMQNRAAGKAADATKRAADKSSAVQREMYYQNREDLAPWREAGGNALSALQHEMGLGERPEGYQGFKATPGYQFRLDEGKNALEKMQSARGTRFGGNALKEFADYNQGQASQEYGNHWNRLSGIAGTGQTATNTTATLGANYAGAAGQNMLSAGRAKASGYLGQAEAFGNTIDAFGSTYGDAKSGMYGPNPGFGIKPVPNALARMGY